MRRERWKRGNSCRERGRGKNNAFLANWMQGLKRRKQLKLICEMGFPGGSVVKNPPANEGYAGSIPESGRSPGEGNGNPL